MARMPMRIGLAGRPVGAEGGHGDGDAAVVEDDRGGAGDRARQHRQRGRGRPAGPRGRRRTSRTTTWSWVRHSRRCFSAASGAGGATAPQRCSRATVVLRQRRRPRRGTGQTPVTGRPGVHRPAGTAVGRVRDCGSSAVIAPRIAGTRLDRAGEASAATTDVPRERKNPGDDLFSRKAALSVSSALESLTSVFGMGTGVASPLESPGSFASGSFRQRLDARSR